MIRLTPDLFLVVATSEVHLRETRTRTLDLSPGLPYLQNVYILWFAPFGR